MKIITNYFVKLKKLPEDIAPIAICGKAPDWYKGLQYKKLVPKYNFFMKWKQDHNDEEYIRYCNDVVPFYSTPDVFFSNFKYLSRLQEIILLFQTERGIV